MATSNYDVNVQLALATTAQQDGNLFAALAFLAEAQRLARSADGLTRARVLVHTARFRIRQGARLPRPALAF